MTPNRAKLLSRLANKDAVIIGDIRGGCRTFAAYPRGDRRCRPISWISKDVFCDWLADGILVENGKGFKIVAGASVRAQTGQHGAAQRMGLEQMEKAEGWARRSGRTVLKLADWGVCPEYSTSVTATKPLTMWASLSPR